MRVNWEKFGHLLEWLGILYFIGFALFGAISILVLIPRYQTQFYLTGQGGIFVRLEEIIGPLVLFFLVISAASWYLGKELREEIEPGLYDKIVAVALFLTTVFILTPQLYLAITSLIPAIK